MPSKTYGWTDVEEIAIQLYEAYPSRDPLGVRFTELKDLVQRLDGFQASVGQVPNEKILEAIQSAWNEEYKDAGGEELSLGDDDDE